jgi:hypothetical protein
MSLRSPRFPAAGARRIKRFGSVSSSVVRCPSFVALLRCSLCRRARSSAGMESLNPWDTADRQGQAHGGRGWRSTVRGVCECLLLV